MKKADPTRMIVFIRGLWNNNSRLPDNADL